ncbi:uncharacterized protein [Euwallacea fornicatus]|uniref:uncharacterized protein n=1 Tax=Euwallacea fornicatus TaxID=995702 RepID=UPI003390367F
MWKLFNDSENVYMLQVQKRENASACSVSITDLTFIWEREFSIANLVDIFKEVNPLISATDEQISSNFWEILEILPHDSIDITVATDNTNMTLTLKKKCANFKNALVDYHIVYKLILVRANPDQFKSIVTIPAMQTIYFLEKQQSALLNLIKKKDRELEEFRMEKGDISRDDLKTDKFDSDLLKTDVNGKFLNLFTDEKNTKFWQKFSELNGEIKPTNLHIELEPWNSGLKRKIIYSNRNVIKKGSGVNYKKL